MDHPTWAIQPTLPSPAKFQDGGIGAQLQAVSEDKAQDVSATRHLHVQLAKQKWGVPQTSRELA